MNRKSIWTIVVVLFILVILGIVGGYFYLAHTKTTIEEVRKENGTAGGVAPFGDLPPITDIASTTDSNPSNPLVGEVPRLREISVTPVAGADIFDRKEGTTTRAYIRFIDKGTGNIYETSTSSLDTIRVTNTTIPKVQEALVSASGNSIILRYSDNVDNIQTFLGSVSGTSSELVGSFAPLNALPLTLSSLKTRFFYMIPGVNGSTWYVSDFSNKPKQVFSSPLREWLVSWPNESSIVVTTKPSSIAGGVAYQFNLAGSSLIKLLGPKNGLVTLASPKIDSILFSETINDTLLTGIHDVKTGSERQIEAATIPDKCIWAPIKQVVYCGTPKVVPSGEYPDVWYQGLITFDDRITSIDSSLTGMTTLIDPEAVSGQSIDATDLHLSSDENYLIFTNKKDLSLWGLRLN